MRVAVLFLPWPVALVAEVFRVVAGQDARDTALAALAARSVF
jgi:hypothetical protein